MDNPTMKNMLNLVDYLPGNYIVYQKEGTVLTKLYHTKDIPSILGFSDEELNSIDNPFDIVLEEDRVMLQKLFTNLQIKEASKNQEVLFRVLHKIKGFIWVHMHIVQYAVIDKNSVWLVSLSDVSKETSISYALMEASDRFICVIERSTKRFLYANSRFYDLVDSTPAKAMGKHCYELLCKTMEMKTNNNCLCYSSINANPPIETYNPEKQIYLTMTGKEVVWGEYDAYVFYLTDITDKKRKEAELEDSQKRFEVALENSELMIWEYDIVNSRCIASQKATSAYNIPLIIENYPESLYDMGHTPRETIEQIKEVKKRLLNGETGFFVERRTINKEGQSEWQKVEYTLECDENGKPLRAIVCGLDITKQKELEQKYEEQMEYRNKFAENAMFSIRLDLDSDIILDYTSAEPDWEKIVKKVQTTSELLIEFFAMISFDEESELTKEKLTKQALVETYELGQSQYRTICRYTALNKYLDLNLSMYKNPGNKHLEVFYLITDVTENILAQKALENVANKDYDFVILIDSDTGKASIVASSQGAMLPSALEDWKIDYNQIIVEFAKSYRSSYQTEEDFQSVSDGMLLAAIKEKLKVMAVYEFSCKTVSQLGEVHTFRLRFSYIDEFCKYIVFTRTNITKAVQDERAIQQKLEKALKIAKDADKAKTDFLSRMSHDMRTPMNGIIGMTRLTQDIKGLSDEVKNNLSAIADSSIYLLQLINDTLDMNKIASNRFKLNPETVKADEMIRHVITTLKPLVDAKKIQLEFNPCNTELDYVWADRVRLEQVCLNILSNAVKFTPIGGRVLWKIEILSRENNLSHCRIIIEDNGCGMSEEYLKHIYEPFSQEQTHIIRGQEGTGLGMSIVKNLVELMGGRIEIESHQGEGTKVTLYLDFERVIGISEEEPIEDEQKMQNLVGKRILLAEDHPLNATIAIRLLEKKGMVVERAEDGLEAVNMFVRAKAKYYDLILMDIRMPQMDGLEAVRKIRALERNDAKIIPIIAMTANAYLEDVQASLAAGMNAHIAKPVNPELLYETLIKHLVIV